MFADTSQRSFKRFSLLLLEDGDDYVQDWVATAVCKTPKPQTPWIQPETVLKGRLRLCSRSFFFEPDQVRTPILMFPFRKVGEIDQAVTPRGTSDQPASDSPNSRFKFGQEAPHSSESGGGILVHTQLLVKMKENGVDAPYVYEKGDSLWVLHLEYAPVQQFLGQAKRLLEINSLDYQERDKVLAAMAREREGAAKFDTSRLADLSEHILLDLPAAQVTPLVREPGRLVITQSRLYFQPLYNLNNDSPVRSHPLTVLLAVARRRHSLRHIGVEVFFGYEKAEGFGGLGSAAGPDGPSAFFTFGSFEEREMTVKMLLHQIALRSHSAPAVGSILEVDPRWQTRVMRAWQTGLITNYDYLIYLNLAAGRSFNDLTQWPVLPWILADYTSQTLDLQNPKTFRDLAKPIGALNPARLEIVRERCRQMPPGEKFLYGTHYSTPGYVLYWLVRAAPAHMLRLQAGRFDAPDRLFLSIPDSWDSVLNNPADVKELIPHFFALPADFLVNKEELNLGIRQNGTPVGDVVLPAWADSPEDFVQKHRAALESDHVCSRLHQWIDLIFGCKQRGEAALAADNLFHHLTYEGAVDLEKIDNPIQRAGLEAQINEFGQAPRQLFTSPHPVREVEEGSQTGLKGGLKGGLVAESCSRAMSIELLVRILEVVGGLDGGGDLNEEEAVGESALGESAQFIGNSLVIGTEVVVSQEGEALSEHGKASCGARNEKMGSTEYATNSLQSASLLNPGDPGQASAELSTDGGESGNVSMTDAQPVDVIMGEARNGDVNTSDVLRQLESDSSRLARLLEEAEELEEESGAGSGTGLAEGSEEASRMSAGPREGLEKGLGEGLVRTSEGVLGRGSLRGSVGIPREGSEEGLGEGLASKTVPERAADSSSQRVAPHSASLSPFEASKQRLRQFVSAGRPSPTGMANPGDSRHSVSRPLTPLEASKQRLRELIASGRPPEVSPSKQSPISNSQKEGVPEQSTASKDGHLLSGKDSWVEVSAPRGEAADIELELLKERVPAFPRAVESSPLRTRKVSVAQTRPVRMEGEAETGASVAVSDTLRSTDSPLGFQAEDTHGPAENGIGDTSGEAAWVPGHYRNASQSSVGTSEHRLSDVISDLLSAGPSSHAESMSESDLLLRTSSLRIKIARGSDEGSLPGSSAQNPEWHYMLRQRLQNPQTLKIHRGPATALVLLDENASDSMTMYSVGRDGFVKVYSIADEFQVRATRLGTLPLSSVALAKSTDAHPTVLAGSFDNCVYAYSVDYGRVLGKLRAHDDTVSCLKLVGRNESRLMTASWDGSIKVWAMDAGKGGWAGTLGGVISSSSLLPEAEMVEHDSAIWSLEVDRRGDVAFSGAEDGSVIAWDLRKPGPSLWHDKESAHPICSLKLANDSIHLLIAATNGGLRIIDRRKSGDVLASTQLSEKIRCCEMAGDLVLAGSENGAVHVWPSRSSDSLDSKEVNGDPIYLDYSPLVDHSDAITCLHMVGSRSGQEGHVATASEDGTIRLYKVGRRE